MGWIQGEPFYELLEIMNTGNVKFGTGISPRKPKIDHTVEICEIALAYEGTLALGALIEIVKLTHPDDNDELVKNLKLLQRRLKYGLPTDSSIDLYELGFTDRVLSLELDKSISFMSLESIPLIMAIKKQEKKIRETLIKYPSYFTERLNEIM